MDKFASFLFDNNINDQIFEGNYNLFKLHKEVYNDRFTVLYVQKYKDGLSGSDYEIGGYIDVKNKVIYDRNFWISNLTDDNEYIKSDYFFSLLKRIKSDIQKNVEKYSLENEEELKKIGRTYFKENELPYIRRREEEIIQRFIQGKEVELHLAYPRNFLDNSEEYCNKNLFVDYLNNPQDVINKYTKEIIDKEKESLGTSLLIYEYEKEYFDKIKNNRNNEFENVYISKNIYDAIRDLDVKTISITIKYSEKYLTFKYDYSRFLRDVINGYDKSNDYGKAYQQVSDFVKENIKDGKSCSIAEFDFNHISLITYSKKELYRNDNIKDQYKTKERGER